MSNEGVYGATEGLWKVEAKVSMSSFLGMGQVRVALVLLPGRLPRETRERLPDAARAVARRGDCHQR